MSLIPDYESAGNRALGRRGLRAGIISLAIGIVCLSLIVLVVANEVFRGIRLAHDTVVLYLIGVVIGFATGLVAGLISNRSFSTHRTLSRIGVALNLLLLILASFWLFVQLVVWI